MSLTDRLWPQMTSWRIISVLISEIFFSFFFSSWQDVATCLQSFYVSVFYCKVPACLCLHSREDAVKANTSCKDHPVSVIQKLRVDLCSRKWAAAAPLRNSMWQTDMSHRLSSRFFFYDNHAVSPCRMDWFKLQRFEKVFNASSTRIVTRKGVKWVTGGSTDRMTCATAARMWLSRMESYRFSFWVSQKQAQESLNICHRCIQTCEKLLSFFLNHGTLSCFFFFLWF